MIETARGFPILGMTPSINNSDRENRSSRRRKSSKSISRSKSREKEKGSVVKLKKKILKEKNIKI